MYRARLDNDKGETMMANPMDGNTRAILGLAEKPAVQTQHRDIHEWRV
jgi:hypothetical protein